MRNDAYYEARARLVQHPDAIRHSACARLHESVDVFGRNARVVVNILQAGSTEELGWELVQNVRPSPLRQEFMAQLTQALHNFLASAASLIDHSRRTLIHAPTDVRRDYEKHAEVFAKTIEASFIKDLRNFSSHFATPPLLHRVSSLRKENGEFETTSTSSLPTPSLLQWDGWKATTKSFLARNPEQVDILPLLNAYIPRAIELGARLHDGIMNSIDFVALDELVVTVNAELAGISRDEARILTSEATRRTRDDRTPPET
jgi:hypothetical protein